ncbi:MAG: dicarboxylate/amino acid:cation symporter [Bryobacteraceae bacterium]|nr:dicarboxylate/amino acid:cation symporter [Bryobacteraceae bacterium]
MNLGLTAWMLIALAAGIVLGSLAPEWSRQLAVVSTIFLNLIQSVIAPLLFGLLVSSLAGIRQLRDLGRIGLRALIYFEIATALALLIGCVMMLWIEPGRGLALASTPLERAAPLDLRTVIANSFPSSVIAAMQRSDILPLVIFCLLFGAACQSVGDRARPVVAFAESLSHIAQQYTRYVMFLAPFAVCAAIASTLARHGWAIFASLGKFIATAYAAQLLFAFLILGGLLRWARVPWLDFWRAAREPFLVAFATTSSAAAIPLALRNISAFGVPSPIVHFVMPVGLSFNLAGSTIHLIMAALFVAQAANISLSTPTLLLMLATLKLTSKGVAGIPRANFVILSGLFATFSLPPEGLPLLLGIDAVIDMIRTGVNILGHCVGPIVIARLEGWRYSRAAA